MSARHSDAPWRISPDAGSEMPDQTCPCSPPRSDGKCCPLVAATGRCRVGDVLVVRAFRSASVAQVPASRGGSAKRDSGAVAGGAVRRWCSGIALAWECRHAHRRWPGQPAEVVAGPATVRWPTDGGRCCCGSPLRDSCTRWLGLMVPAVTKATGPQRPPVSGDRTLSNGLRYVSHTSLPRTTT